MADSTTFVSDRAEASGDRNSLEAVRAALGDRPGLMPLMGEVSQAERLPGLSNSVFGVVAEHGAFVLRVPAAKSAGLIDRQGEHHNLCLAARAGLAVEPLFFDEEDGLMLMRRKEIAKGAVEPFALGKLIADLHLLEGTFQGTLDLPGLLRSLLKSAARTGSFATELTVIRTVLDGLPDMAGADPSGLVPSHCDLSPGNILKTTEGLQLIDFEFSAMALPEWDLAYALLENEMEGPAQSAFLEGYSASGGQLPEASSLQEMMQRCDAVSALWALEQAGLGNARTNFPAFAKARIKRMREREAL